MIGINIILMEMKENWAMMEADNDVMCKEVVHA